MRNFLEKTGTVVELGIFLYLGFAFLEKMIVYVIAMLFGGVALGLFRQRFKNNLFQEIKEIHSDIHGATKDFIDALHKVCCKEDEEIK